MWGCAHIIPFPISIFDFLAPIDTQMQKQTRQFTLDYLLSRQQALNRGNMRQMKKLFIGK